MSDHWEEKKRSYPNSQLYSGISNPVFIISFENLKDFPTDPDPGFYWERNSVPVANMGKHFIFSLLILCLSFTLSLAFRLSLTRQFFSICLTVFLCISAFLSFFHSKSVSFSISPFLSFSHCLSLFLSLSVCLSLCLSLSLSLSPLFSFFLVSLSLAFVQKLLNGFYIVCGFKRFSDGSGSRVLLEAVLCPCCKYGETFSLFVIDSLSLFHSFSRCPSLFLWQFYYLCLTGPLYCCATGGETCLMIEPSTG